MKEDCNSYEEAQEPDSMTAKRGLYNKYVVQRVDGSALHKDCDYFVLDLDHDRFAIAALRAYAKACRSDNPCLSDHLRAKAYSLDTRNSLD